MDENLDLNEVWLKCQHAQVLAISNKTKVGAVVVGINKKNERKLFVGSNIHISDSFADVHAEQMAVNQCLLERYYPLAVYVTSTSTEEKVALCGSCRHYLSEINRNMQVVVFNPDGSRKITTFLFEVYPNSKDTRDKNEKIQIETLGMAISPKSN